MTGIHRWSLDFPSQSNSNAENVSIWWRHRVLEAIDLNIEHRDRHLSNGRQGGMYWCQQQDLYDDILNAMRTVADVNRWDKQRVLTPGHQGWNDLHSLCRIGMEYYLLNNDDNNNNDDDDDDDDNNKDDDDDNRNNNNNDNDYNHNNDTNNDNNENDNDKNSSDSKPVIV